MKTLLESAPNLLEQRLAIPNLPESEIKHLLRALNRANAAMKKWQVASGIAEHNHFELVEQGNLRSPLPGQGYYLAGKFVETRSKSTQS